MSDELIRKLQERQFGQYMATTRNARVSAQSYADWHSRISDVDRLVAGDYTVTFGNQISTTERPMVQNLAETMTKDVARLVSDQSPTVRSFERNESEKEDRKQQQREAIAYTHWDENDGDLYVPLWAMDLVITGAAFATCYVDEEFDYPRFERIDPRYCFPDIYNRKLLDLVVVQGMKLRQAAQLFPQLGLNAPEVDDDTDVEVIDYISKGLCVKSMAKVKDNVADPSSTYIVSAWEPVDVEGKPILPVAFQMLPSHDGAIRGLLDLVGDSLVAKNKLIRLMTKYAEQQVTSPIIAKGVINMDKPGPNVIYQLDPNIPDSQMGRLQPAGGSPQLFGLLSIMDREERGQIAYPEQRQGEAGVSIGSAAFMASTQGQMSSLVREVVQHIGGIRARIHDVCFRLDEKYLDFNKPLTTAIPASNSNEYTPSKVIQGVYRVKVNFGAGAGLDRLNADVRLLQLYGAGLIDAETARENLEFVESTDSIEDKWEREQVRKALMQRFVGDPNAPFDILLDVESFMEEGMSFSKAVKAARQAAAAKAEQQVQQPQMPQAPAGMAQGGPAAQVPEQAIQAGATSPDKLGGTGEVQFSPPPMEQVFVRTGGNG